MNEAYWFVCYVWITSEGETLYENETYYGTVVSWIVSHTKCPEERMRLVSMIEISAQQESQLSGIVG